jgi:hypothetical protein
MWLLLHIQNVGQSQPEVQSSALVVRTNFVVLRDKLTNDDPS